MKKVKIPSDRQIYKGDMATYWMEDGVLVSVSNNTMRTVERIHSNVEFIKSITEGKKVPSLIFLEKSPTPDKKTRKLSAEKMPEIYTAMAMISKPGLAKLIMNMLFAVNPPPIPMKSFSTKEEGMVWLKNFKK